MTGTATAVGPSRLKHALTSLRGERLLLHNLIVGSGTIAAGLLGIAFQSMASHQLRPDAYGGVFAVVTLITFVALPAQAFTLLMARETSRGQATGHHAASAALLRHGDRALLTSGLVLACVLGLGSPLVSRFLDLPADLLLVAALGFPFGLALPLLLGAFQGEQRFTELASLSVGTAALKLAAAVGLGLAFGPAGIVGGISLATFATYVVARALLRRRFAIHAHVPWVRRAAAYVAVILPSTIALGVLLSSDVILVKHYFPSGAAGGYAAVAAVGRAVFWGASGVAIVLFPKITFHTAQGRSGLKLVTASLALVAAGGAVSFAVLTFISARLLTAFAGTAYTTAAGYLPLYAAGMMLLGGAAVLVAAQQSRGEPGFLAILLPLSAVEPLLIVLFHRTLMQVVQVVDLSMLLVLAGLAGLYLAQERGKALVPPVEVSKIAIAVPGLELNR